MKRQYQEFYDFAVETAYLAGRLTLGYFQTGVQPDFKKDNSPVTIADKKAEELIRSRIEKKYPDHSVVGEEFGEKSNKNSDFTWYIDPIDGTKSFIRGVPLYAVLIGLEIEGEVKTGAVYFPALNEMLAAYSGGGCWWNGRRAQVSEISSLDKAVVSFTDPAAFEEYGKLKAWQNISRKCYYRAGWGDAYGHCLAATGRIELMLDPIMNDWDCGPFPPVLQEAGGYFGDWQGSQTIHGKEALSTSLLLLPEVLELIRDKE